MARLAQTRPCIVIFCNICRNTDRMGSTDRYRTVHLIIIHSQISAALNNSDQKFSRRPRNKLHDSTRSRRAFPGTADFSALRSGHRFVPIKPRRAFFATSQRKRRRDGPRSTTGSASGGKNAPRNQSRILYAPISIK